MQRPAQIMEQRTPWRDARSSRSPARTARIALRPPPRPSAGLRVAANVVAAALALGFASHALGQPVTAAGEPAMVRLAVPFPVTGPIDIQGAERTTPVYRMLSPHAPQPVSDVAAEIVRLALASAPGTRVAVVRRSSTYNRLNCRHGGDEAAPSATLVLVNHEAIAADCRTDASLAAPASSPQPQLVAPIAVMPLVLVKSARFAPPDFRHPPIRTPTKPVAIGSPGAYSAGRVAAELLREVLGIELLPVGYNGGHAALNALLAGEIDLMFAAAPLALPYIRAGRVPAIGAASLKRLALLPGLPTLAELGYPGLAWEGWFALYAVDGLDAPGRARLGRRLSAALSAPGVRSTLIARGLHPADPDPVRFAERVAVERAQVARLPGAAE